MGNLQEYSIDKDFNLSDETYVELFKTITKLKDGFGIMKIF